MSDALILGFAQLLFPFLVALAVYGYKRFIASLPASQQERAKSIIRTGVTAVEQQCSVMEGPDKKREALRWITLALSEAGLKVSPTLLDGLIEQAVFAVNTGAKDIQNTQVGLPAVQVK